MGSLGTRTRPCKNCGKFAGYFHKRGRSKYWLRICNGCDKKYDVKM